jgi:DNA-directed RNA polymerase subunit RPC12/RpoP
MKPQMHRCSSCKELFDAAKSRASDLSWHSIFTRPVKALPLGEDIESFELVKCPKCGHTEGAPELRLFGVIPAKRVKLVLGVLFVLILAFGYWLIRWNTSQ